MPVIDVEAESAGPSRTSGARSQPENKSSDGSDEDDFVDASEDMDDDDIDFVSDSKQHN